MRYLQPCAILRDADLARAPPFDKCFMAPATGDSAASGISSAPWSLPHAWNSNRRCPPTLSAVLIAIGGLVVDRAGRVCGDPSGGAANARARTGPVARKGQREGTVSTWRSSRRTGSVRQGELHSWLLQLTSAAGQPIDDAVVTIDGGMPRSRPRPADQPGGERPSRRRQIPGRGREVHDERLVAVALCDFGRGGQRQRRVQREAVSDG